MGVGLPRAAVCGASEPRASVRGPSVARPRRVRAGGWGGGGRLSLPGRRGVGALPGGNGILPA